MEYFNFKNYYGQDIYIYPRAEDDKFILIKNNYKAGTYLISEIINDGVNIVDFDELNIDNKEVFDKKMQEHYLIHIANETCEITDGNYNLYEFQVGDILNDFRVTYDDNILKRVEIQTEDDVYEDFYLYLYEEELKEAKNIIVNNAVEDFEKGFKEIAKNQQEKFARTFIEFFYDGEYVDIHLVLAYESEYRELLDSGYADNPGEYGTRISLNNDNYFKCVLISLSTNKVIAPYPYLKEIVYDIWKELLESIPIMNVTSDYKIVEPLEYD